MKARIFDLVQRGGGDGIPFRDLQSMVGLTSNTLKVHLYQINQAIMEAGYRIYSRGSMSRLVRIPPSRKKKNWPEPAAVRKERDRRYLARRKLSALVKL